MSKTFQAKGESQQQTTFSIIWFYLQELKLGYISVQGWYTTAPSFLPLHDWVVYYTSTIDDNIMSNFYIILA